MRHPAAPPPPAREAAAYQFRPYSPDCTGDALWNVWQEHVRAKSAAPAPETPAPPRGLTPPAFSEALGVSPRTLRNWTRAGKVRAVRFSRRCVRYPESELARLLAAGEGVKA